MTPFLMVVSASAMVMQNCFFNSFSKKMMKGPKDIYFFNLFSYIVAITFFGVMTVIHGSLSLFTVVTGCVFGFLTANSYSNRMKALSRGPMHITLLITTSSMIIPTMSGVFFGEPFSLPKFLFVLVLLFFIYLSLGVGGNGKIDKIWFFRALIAFFCQGFIGVMQKIHQGSPEHAHESSGFLLFAFLFSLIYSLIILGKDIKRSRLSRKYFLFSIICGVCVSAMNHINLILSGVLPSQLFFPLVNGSSIIISTLISVIVFKEHMTKKQVIGVCGGIACLIAICLVP